MFVGNSCKEEKSITTFRTISKIESYDSIASDKNAPWGPITDMEIVDSLLVIKHANDEYHFSFFDVNRKKLLTRWGKIGDAPNELLSFGNGFNIIDSKMFFLDGKSKNINKVSIADILNHKEPIDISRETYPYNTDFRPFRINIIKDKKIALGAFKNGRLGILDSLNNIVESSFDYPFEIDEIEGLYKGTVYQANIKSNNYQSKFVISTIASDVFEIYEVANGIVSRTYVSAFNELPKIWKKGGRYAIDYDNSIAGYMNLAVSDSLICFMYSANSYNETASQEFASAEILCFNWRGEKVKKIILPFVVNTYCLDANYIYATRYINDETVLYRFEL